jgi:acyl carrier protein
VDQKLSSAVLKEMKLMFARRGVDVDIDPRAELRQLGFRSLDFSELVLRIEKQIGAQLNFRAAQFRQVERVQDLLDFFQAASDARDRR